MNGIRAVLLFPGWGGNGLELKRTLEAGAMRWPGVALIGLDPPEPGDTGLPGRQWFSRVGITDANRAERVTSARAGLDQAVDAALAGAGVAATETAWGGFSQGAMVVLDAVAHGRHRPRAAVAIAGRLVSEPVATAATSLLLLHGERDEVVPVAASISAQATFAARGYACELVTYPRAGHQLTRPMIARAAAFIDGCTPPAT